MAKRSPIHYPDIGVLGEETVAQWLTSQGWEVLYRRWRCRWGEIDIIAYSSSPMLAFVEVKTRSRGSWDIGGLLAITQHKQVKIFKAAQYFLAKHPHLSSCPCRFDVALVHHAPSPQQKATPEVQQGQLFQRVGCQLTLQEYLAAAFDL